MLLCLCRLSTLNLLAEGNQRMELERLHYIIIAGPRTIKFAQRMKDKADGLGIVGWVSKIVDGSVEVLAEGTIDQLREFQIYVWNELLSPSQRVIDSFVDEPATGDYESFSILHWT